MIASQTQIAGLHPSPEETLPFDPDVAIRAFVLRRPRGNIAIYSTTGLSTDDTWIQNLGGVTRRYLNHWHEAMFSSENVDAPLFVHAADRRRVERDLRVRGSFSQRHVLDEDFEVIPTPGHTPGATAYLWDSGEHRLLFTGDSIYLRDGEWRAAVLDSSDRASYLESLALIRDLDFDVLVPWAATRGEPYFAVVDRAERERRLDEIIDRLDRGEDG